MTQPPEADDAAPSRVGDIGGAIVVIVLHAFMFLFTAYLVSFSAMGTDPCAYVECGDEAWVGRGIGLMWLGGATLLLASPAVCVWRLVKRHKAVPAAFTCFGLHILLTLVAFAMVNQAGPTGS